MAERAEGKIPAEAWVLTYEQVAAALQVSGMTVRRLVKAGELATVNLGHRNPRITREEVQRFINAHTGRRESKRTVSTTKNTGESDR